MLAGRALLVAVALSGCAHPATADIDDLTMTGRRDGGTADLNHGNCPGKDLQNDPMNCGACGNVCQLPHVAMNACKNGACAVGKCAMGYFDINNTGTDGCECQQAPVI